MEIQIVSSPKDNVDKLSSFRQVGLARASKTYIFIAFSCIN